jgi:hypothetical protein
MMSCVSNFTSPAGRRQLVERRQRNQRLVADAVHLDDDLRGQRLDQFAFEKSDHGWGKNSEHPINRQRAHTLNVGR